VLLAAAAVRSGEQCPAVGGDLQGWLQGGQGRVLGPGGSASAWLCGGWGHRSQAGLLAFASAGRQDGHRFVAARTVGMRTCEPWLLVRDLPQ